MKVGEAPEFIDIDSDRGAKLFSEWVDQNPEEFVAKVEH